MGGGGSVDVGDISDIFMHSLVVLVEEEQVDLVVPDNNKEIQMLLFKVFCRQFFYVHLN